MCIRDSNGIDFIYGYDNVGNFNDKGNDDDVDDDNRDENMFIKSFV